MGPQVHASVEVPRTVCLDARRAPDPEVTGSLRDADTASCDAQKTRANRASELRISKGNTVLRQRHTGITHYS
jgi:hypothetical protein